MKVPTDPNFEALAQKLEAVREEEPPTPLPTATGKGRGGIPAKALERLEKLATNPGRLSPFGPGVEITNPGEQ